MSQNSPPVPQIVDQPETPPPWWNTPPPWMSLVPRRRPLVRRFLMAVFILLFLLSAVANIYLGAFAAAQLDRGFDKTVMQPGKEDQTVAVYGVEGVIDGKTAAQFSKFCSEVTKDKNVKAVVLRVDSPGGTVAASDQMHTHVAHLKAQGKKVVVSMGGVAASGGYYISAGADEIIAEPTTVTGSIGVIAGWVVLKGTLDKIGAEAVVVKSTHARGWKDEMSLFRKPDDREMEHIQTLLDKIQEQFEKVVKEGRGDKLKTKTATYRIATSQGAEARTVQHTETEPFNGKVYLAADALGLGLVDEIGYQDKAVDQAVKLAGLTKAHVVHYQARKGILEEILMSRSGALALDRNTLEDLQTPRLMMIWKPE